MLQISAENSSPFRHDVSVTVAAPARAVAIALPVATSAPAPDPHALMLLVAAHEAETGWQPDRSIHFGKRVSADLRSTTAADQASQFLAREHRVADLATLFNFLQTVARHPNAVLIRAALRDGVRADGVRRLLHPRENDPAVFRPAARVYLPVDIDKLPLPPGTEPTDLTACAHAALAVLPPEFQAADCICQFSGSHGIKQSPGTAGIRVRLWFETSRPVHCGEAKNWLRDAPVDLAAFGPVQLIYVTPPIFPEGARDPLTHRFVWLRGERRTVAVPDALPAPPGNVVRLHAAGSQSGAASGGVRTPFMRQLAAVALALPNDGWCDDRNAWIGVAHAFAASFAGAKPAGSDRELWRRLNERWTDAAGKPRQQTFHEEDGIQTDEFEYEFVWRKLGDSHAAGPGAIISHARGCVARAQRSGANLPALAAAVRAYDDAAHAARIATAQAEFQATAEPPRGWIEQQEHAASAAPAENDDDDADDPKALRDRAINAVLDAGVTFWRDPDHAVYASVPHAGAVQRYRVRSGAFGRVVRRLYGSANPVKAKHGTRLGSLPDAVVKDVLPALEAIATHSDDVRKPAVRVHGADDGTVWIDLGRDDWSAVRVTADGWQVVTSADVPLIRPEGSHPLPIPQRDPAALAKLRGLLNLHGADHDGAFMLIVAWLVAALYPTGPYCVLALDGEQGSGKTTTATMLRRLIDPNHAGLRATPRSEDDLIIAAMNSRIVAYDNLSHVEPWLADAICRLATGAGFGKRKLYSDGDEVLVNVSRPTLLNGIPTLLARGDLADRSLEVTLPVIPDDRRRPESEVRADFDAAHPGILALLLDGLATAIRRLPDLKLSKLPRMADFARVACAAAPAFGWKEADNDKKDGMLDAILQNRDGVVATVLEADPLATAVQAFAAEAAKTDSKAVADRDLLGMGKIGTWADGGWSGTATELLSLLGGYVSVEDRRAWTWPKDAARLGARLRRIAPALRRIKVDVAQAREGNTGRRLIAVQRTKDETEK